MTDASRKKIERCGIGSDFYLPNRFVSEKSQMDKYSPLADRKIFLSSGRCAFKYIVKSLGFGKGDRILLPSYMCPEVLNPFLTSGLKISYFKVDNHLNANFEDVSSLALHETKMLVLIHYFGYPQRDLKKICEFCTENGILVLEDVVQSFLSRCDNMPIGSVGDFSINSYRKWIPVPDGCMLTVNDDERIPMDSVRIAPSPPLYFQRLALRIKGFYSRRPIFSSYLHRGLSILGESHVASEPSNMSNETRWQIEHTNFDKIAERRRENFKIILDTSNELKSVKPFFDNLPSGVCPIGFPVICNERDKLKEYLINKRIYPSVHWVLPSEISEDKFPVSAKISKSILTLPMDQRYSSEEINIITAYLRKFDRNVV